MHMIDSRGLSKHNIAILLSNEHLGHMNYDAVETKIKKLTVIYDNDNDALRYDSTAMCAHVKTHAHAHK